MKPSKPAHRRDQRLVAKLVEILDRGKLDLSAARARARNLPTMLRRHGPIPVLLFLASKDGSDAALAECLIEAVSEILSDAEGARPEGYATKLAGMPLSRYLLHWQTSVEAAGWLKRLIEARCEAAQPVGSAAGA